MTNNKILIIGANGMLGHDLVRVFSCSEPVEGFDLNPICWDQEEIDITDEKLVFQKIGDLKPDIVINSAAYTDVDGCETNRELAMKVNGYAVGYLASICQKIGAVFVHYSTDYVFDGKNPHGYREDDIPKNPLNVYGESKLLGERMIANCRLQNADFKYFLIRTSWLFGPAPDQSDWSVRGKEKWKNFVSTILKLAQERDELKVVNDQHGKPTYTLDLARKTRELLFGETLPHEKTQSLAPAGSCCSALGGRPRPFSKRAGTMLGRLREAFLSGKVSPKFPPGIYHITNENETTWYDFSHEIFRQAKELGILKKIPKAEPHAQASNNIGLMRSRAGLRVGRSPAPKAINNSGFQLWPFGARIIPCASAEFPLPAQRPAYSTLINTKLPPMRSWKEALTDYLKEVKIES